MGARRQSKSNLEAVMKYSPLVPFPHCPYSGLPQHTTYTPRAQPRSVGRSNTGN